ncbi:hypothetical protein [Actinomadura sp. 3N508]|uniref:hypothetical protein n=1 Tax=Actinomadura sp. 3N508 TaxID=3375153 RepID=UPI0037BB393B
MPESRELPDLLQEIKCGEAEAALDALFHLRMKICPQGVAVNQRTAAALPILIDIIATNKSVIRKELMQLVVEISRSSHAWRSSARNAQPEYVGNYADKIEWETAVDRAFEEAMPALARLESDVEPEVAAMASGVAGRHRKA